MTRYICRSLLVTFLFAATLSRAAEHQITDALKTADDERVAATIASDKRRMDAVLAADLHYAHSTGAVDTKDSYIDLVTAGRLKYLSYHYEERKFTVLRPDVALMTARARIKSESAGGVSEGVLSALAVWRLEKGRWRFLAWQSCRIPDGAPAGK
jgi:ketosteroid isomerase-like protein